MRIKCKTPSTGRPVNFYVTQLATTWTTVVQAPDFSVPDTSNVYPNRDPDDITRAIRPGEIFMLTPVFARNNSSTLSVYVETRLVIINSNGTETYIACPGKQTIPVGDTALVPLQGRSILKRYPSSITGDRIEMRASVAGVIDVWGSGEEKLSAEHTGVIA